MASLWNEKARKWIAGRRNIPEELSRRKSINHKTIWFHCASVGEYEQALPLIALCKNRYPDHQILTTFYSPSGYEYAQKKYPDEWISYLPYDKRRDIAEFVTKVAPAIVFIIKYEFWHHLLHEIHQRKIPLFLVSAIFRKEQMFFRSYGNFYRQMLHCFTHIFVQNEESKSLLSGISIKHVTVAGDTRFDRVIENRKMDFQDSKITDFLDSDKVFVAGSVWNSDIAVLQNIINTLPPDWKILIAPHETDHFQTNWMQDDFCRYTGEASAKARIMLIDTVGILSKLYRYAYFVYVGGGFGKGIHNILEPVVYLKPVLIGKNYHKFNEAKELILQGGVFEVTPENAGNLVKNTIFDENKYYQVTGILNTYMSANTNLSEKILVYVDGHLNL